MGSENSFEDVAPLGRLPHEWEAWAKAKGLPAYRGRQLFRWLHHRLEVDPAAMSDLPKAVRGELEGLSLAWPFAIHASHQSPDGTQKLLLRLGQGGVKRADAGVGPRDIETVLIPQLRRQDPDWDEDAEGVEAGAEVEFKRAPGNRVTQCISSQLGCAMGCVFCASGLAGLRRSLGAEEIVGQVMLGRATLREQGEREQGATGQLTNVVFMGMGEPLHNYDAVARTVRLLTEPTGLALSFRRVTVSTSGLVPEIDRLGKEFDGRVQLAISLHSAFDERRSELMPINRKYPLKELMASLRRYPLPKRRRITMEYTLIRGVNDRQADIRALTRLLSGIPVKVNLIPMNPVEESDLSAPDALGVDRFRKALQESGFPCFVRTQRGDEITAACGQLALREADGARAPVRIKRRRPTSEEAP